MWHIMPDDVTENAAEYSLLGCNHQRVCTSYSLYVQLLCYSTNVLPRGDEGSGKLCAVIEASLYWLLAPLRIQTPAA